MRRGWGGGGIRVPESLLSGGGLQACCTRPVGLCHLRRLANAQRYFESGLPSDCPQFQTTHCHHLTSYKTVEGLGHTRGLACGHQPGAP